MSATGQQLERITEGRNTQQLHDRAWQQSQLEQTAPETRLASDSDYRHRLTNCDLAEGHFGDLVQLKTKFNLGSHSCRQAG